MQGRSLWDRFNPEAGQSGTLAYYRGLVTAYNRRIGSVQDARLGRLVEAYEREVGALEALVGATGN
jgi:hypothetical protein